MLEFAKRNYNKVVVVLNESTTMEVGDLKDDNDIDGIIWAGSPGSTGFNALGEILAGTVNPSGKTPDLYSRDFTKDPTFQNFAINGENTYTGVTEISGGVNGSKSAHLSNTKKESMSDIDIMRHASDQMRHPIMRMSHILSVMD